MVERLAAAGVKGNHRVYGTAQKLLGQRGDVPGSGSSSGGGGGGGGGGGSSDSGGESNVQTTAWGRPSLHATRPLLQLWRHGAKHRFDFGGGDIRRATPDGGGGGGDGGGGCGGGEVRSGDQQLGSVVRSLFDEPERPLVVDLGCGYGTSIVGLGRLNIARDVQGDSGTPYGDRAAAPRTTMDEAMAGTAAGTRKTMAEANYLGVDLNTAALAYARATIARSNLTDRVAVVAADCEELLHALETSYPGPVVVIMCQFPTPYRLDDGQEGSGEVDRSDSGGRGGGNPMLPSFDEFLVTEALVNQSGTLLQRTGGLLLLQSNAEDVAQRMADLVEDSFASDLTPVPCVARSAKHYTARPEGGHAVIPQRQERWRSRRRQPPEPALVFTVGEDWQPTQEFPLTSTGAGNGNAAGRRRARSETEAAYEHDRKPIFRLLFHRPAV